MNKKCEIDDATMTVLKDWYGQAKADDLSAGAVYKDQTQKEFGIMVLSAAKGFACSYSNCGGSDGELLCLYNKAAPAPNADLYTEAQGDVCDACPADDPCTAYTCKPKLYELDTNANPQPMCANPGDDGMTYDMQMTARNMANYYRNLVATGWAQDKNGYAPTAKDMNALVYDCDAAGADAKTEAANCMAASYTPTQGYVLNSYKTNNYHLPREEVLKQAMSSWFAQLKSADLDEQAKYDQNVKTTAPDFANVRDLVYGKATKVGCAVGTCLREGFQVAICQFDSAPADGDPLYTVGKTCSRCPAGKTCHKSLSGLCA
ncbi:SCP-like protein [Ancylostoma caninum]|uniref:SCP-like protein n=1 Tax=Ancylostoma caninum TaxID=29170 RepID=A0A368FC14_ANCCA|nr:SCP-like protein [Ancylostoma caninum]